MYNDRLEEFGDLPNEVNYVRVAKIGKLLGF